MTTRTILDDVKLLVGGFGCAALVLLATLGLAKEPHFPTKPDFRLTPGVLAMVKNPDGTTRPLNREELCTTKWGKDRRHVTTAMRRQVFALYHIPYMFHALVELDHLISRENGGADDVRNLWPELWPDAHEKDKLENALHRQICKGDISIEDAQEQLRQWGR